MGSDVSENIFARPCKTRGRQQHGCFLFRLSVVSSTDRRVNAHSCVRTRNYTPPSAISECCRTYYLRPEMQIRFSYMYNRWLGSRVVSVLDSGTVVQIKPAWVQIAAATLSGNSFRQTVHTLRTSVHQAAKLVAAFLRVERVTALKAACRRVYDSRHLQADCQEPGSVLETYARQSSVSNFFTTGE